MSIFNAVATFIASGLLTLSRIAARTSTVTGTGVDVAGYTGAMLFVQDVGTVSGTTPTLDGKLQDSADDSSYADVAGLTFTQVTTSNNTQMLQVNVDSVRRYVRWVGTIGGTTPSFMCGVTAVGMKPTV
jgi:hypothetical protein